MSASSSTTASTTTTTTTTTTSATSIQQPQTTTTQHDQPKHQTQPQTTTPPSPSTPPTLINNTTQKYIPHILPQTRTTLQISTKLLQQHHHHNSSSLYNQILTTLSTDLSTCLTLLPPSLHPLFHRTQIWINHSYNYGLITQPRKVIHTTVHHDTNYLNWIRDVPQKVHGIEIYDAEFYLKNRWHWNGCGLILHEFCHLVHQFVFGLEFEGIKELFGEVVLRSKGRYECVLRRDWAGLQKEYDMAYALINHKEFFAEMSVAYLATSYQELNEFVGAGDYVKKEKKEEEEQSTFMKQCSPVITSPDVLKRFRNGMTNDQNNDNNTLSFSTLQQEEEEEEEKVTPHCNKFYPFTSGQLKHYDLQLYKKMEELWMIIQHWKDPCIYGTSAAAASFHDKKNESSIMFESTGSSSSDDDDDDDDDKKDCCWGWTVEKKYREEMLTLKKKEQEKEEETMDKMVVMDTVEL